MKLLDRHAYLLDGLGRKRARCGDRKAWRFADNAEQVTCAACRKLGGP
jgi:hypothetical protein